MNLRDLMERPEWMALAECRGMDPELFHPGWGESVSEAREVCRRCEVQAECLAYAVNNAERFGVWGGKSERERRSIRRRLAGKPPRPTIEHGTARGYWQHRNDGDMPACGPCVEAYREYDRQRRAGLASSAS